MAALPKHWDGKGRSLCGEGQTPAIFRRFGFPDGPGPGRIGTALGMAPGANGFPTFWYYEMVESEVAVWDTGRCLSFHLPAAGSD